MKRFTFALFILLITLLSAGTLWAHHSPSAIFDMSKRVTWTGTLTKITWVNPHITLDMESEGQPWHFESNPPAWFRRVGLAKADFTDSIGKMVTIEGVRARDGAHYGYMLKITLADGRSLEATPDTK